jgi:hypothetical protein
MSTVIILIGMSFVIQTLGIWIMMKGIEHIEEVVDRIRDEQIDARPAKKPEDNL